MTDVEDEVELQHDGVTTVVRAGGTVRRPIRPFTATVQAYLRHVRLHGADFVPEPLGYDERGREVLEFIEGDVPIEPLPAWAASDEALTALARLIRRLHDAAQGWEVPSDAVWGSFPGQHSISLPALFDRPELVAHQDYCPGNVVFRSGLPVALIDFDLARPTTRVADCCNALRYWAPLLDPVDRAPALRAASAAERARLFADAYEMTHVQREQIVPTAVQRSRISRIAMRAAADADPIFARWWNDGLEDRLTRAQQWLELTACDIEAALLR